MTTLKALLFTFGLTLGFLAHFASNHSAQGTGPLLKFEVQVAAKSNG